ncbi:MAG: signal peptidase I [Candidatus Kerfeldbacteria bacterium]|nr:signal peptidase I [Candidatus Kerfeldbacteria bacterium]
MPTQSSEQSAQPTISQSPYQDPHRVGHRRVSGAAQKENVLPGFSKTFLSFLTEIVKVVLISVAIIVPVRYFLVQPFYVKGASMEPTFHDNEYLIIDEITYRFRAPRRGEVVVLRNPRGDADYYIKRIIGLPGEHVTISDGQIRLTNDQFPTGTELDESSYLDASVVTNGDVDLTLEDNQYFILGDNRRSSLDSRSFGPIPRSDIVGRTWLRAWPPSKLAHFPTPVYYSVAP